MPATTKVPTSFLPDAGAGLEHEGRRPLAGRSAPAHVRRTRSAATFCDCSGPGAAGRRRAVELPGAGALLAGAQRPTGR